MLTVAVVSADSTSSGYLRACLQQTGLVRAVVEWNVAKPDVGVKDSATDVILLDIGREPEPYFVLGAQKRRLYPQARIIACSSSTQPDPDFLLQAMRSGVQEFISKPIKPNVLQDILSRFLAESRTSETRAAEKTIVVMGSKGGVGTSTVAVNLGVQLSLVTGKRVVLLDLARPVGHVGLLLDLTPRFTFRDAVDNLERLDGHFFGGLLARHKSGLEILGGATNPEDWSQIPVPMLAQVVNVAQSTSDFVVIDLGAQFSSEWSGLFRLARMILMVAEPNVPSLWAAERHLTFTAGLGIEPERVRVVINRWSRSDEPVLQNVEKSMKRQIFARLPNDFNQVSEAVSLGIPLARNHNNPLVLELRALAGRLAGVNVAPQARRSGFNNLFAVRTVK